MTNNNINYILTSVVNKLNVWVAINSKYINIDPLRVEKIQQHINYVTKRLYTLNLLDNACNPIADILFTEYVYLLSNPNIDIADMLLSLSNKLNAVYSHYVY